MKVYEKMGINLNTIDGVAHLFNVACTDFSCFNECDTGHLTAEQIRRCKAEHLFADVPTKKVKRWETYDGDFEKAVKEFYATHIMTYSAIEDYNNWLMKEIEVEE